MNSDNMDHELDIQLKKMQLEKLKVERDEIKFKVSKAFRRNELVKGYGVIASALAGLAAIGTLIWTIFQGVNQLELQREERTNVRIEKAIRDLNSDGSKLRLYAVSALRILLNENKKSHRVTEILSAISYALATEKEAIVRDSMIALLSSLKKGAISNEDLGKMLSELVGLSRSLVLKEQLWVNHEHYFLSSRDDSAESRAQSIAEAINFLIKNDARVDDLSGIYCAYCDFSNLDLEKTIFSESILYGANFSESNLSNSVFNHVIIERAKFINANLKESSFTDNRKYDKWAGSFAYRRLNKSGGSYEGPDFSCADLSNSNFSEFPLLILSSNTNDPGPYMNKIPPKFIRANLSGADFSNAKVLIFESEDFPDFKEFIEGSSGRMGHTGRPLWSVKFNENTVFNEDYYNKFSLTLIGVKKAFSGSSWKEAILPKGISHLLMKLDSKDLLSETGLGEKKNKFMKELLDSSCVPLEKKIN